jgi:hypothetical protein
MTTETGATVNEADAVREASSVLVAVTVYVPAATGAVHVADAPDGVRVPPLALHVTAPVRPLVTVAVSVCVPAARTAPDVGVTAMLTGGGGGGGRTGGDTGASAPPPPQASRATREARQSRKPSRWTDTRGRRTRIGSEPKRENSAGYLYMRRFSSFRLTLRHTLARGRYSASTSCSRRA